MEQKGVHIFWHIRSCQTLLVIHCTSLVHNTSQVLVDFVQLQKYPAQVPFLTFQIMLLKAIRFWLSVGYFRNQVMWDCSHIL